jgi:single-strand DNA-binding protein
MASRSINKIILLGHLGKDAETKFTPAGVAKTTFTLATSRRWQDKQSGEWKEDTTWHNIVLWRSENVANYLLKGKQVYVEGRIDNRSWEDPQGQKRYMTEVVAEDVILLGGGGAGGGRESAGGGEFDQRPVSMPRSAQRPSAPAPAAPAAHDDFGQGVTDDDVPF